MTNFVTNLVLRGAGLPPALLVHPPARPLFPPELGAESPVVQDVQPPSPPPSFTAVSATRQEEHETETAVVTPSPPPQPAPPQRTHSQQMSKADVLAAKTAEAATSPIAPSPKPARLAPNS